MSSLSKKDRASLCSFTFSDGRRCRTPRIGSHPHFCFYHAQKEARARTAQELGKDLAYFFSGDYLSACDLSTALARLIPAVVRGDVKPKTAHTVAYLVQTLLQAIHISQHEYINAFGTNGWRNAICNSVNSNHDYLFPPDPQPKPPAPHPTAPTVGALNVAAGLQPGAAQAPQPAPASSPTSAHAPQTSASPSYPACHPVRSEGSRLDPAASTAGVIHPIPATQPAQSVAPTAQPNNPPRTAPSTPQPAPVAHPFRGEAFPDSRALHFAPGCRLLVDGKPF
jgi:hypothetical protein